MGDDRAQATEDQFDAKHDWIVPLEPPVEEVRAEALQRAVTVFVAKSSGNPLPIEYVIDYAKRFEQYLKTGE